jgi:hypothetical protein
MMAARVNAREGLPCSSMQRYMDKADDVEPRFADLQWLMTLVHSA